MADLPITHHISENYRTLRVLGQGCFGQVIKCLKKDTKETVAVKVLIRNTEKYDTIREVVILEKLRCLDPDMFNIVRCHECFNRFDRTFMVFEILDMSIYDYICQKKCALIPLNGIRTIIQDLAIAFHGLKGLGLIHTDLKLDNVMLVDQKRHPFRVKLIDFGLALERCDAKPGLNVQPFWYRSPEVILGVPFTEAIDIWSLGSLMAEMLLGFSLFPAKSEYDLLRFITDLLGPLNKNMLDRGKKTYLFYNGKSKYFFYMLTKWTLKTPTEFQTETKIKPVDSRRFHFSSLDELKTFRYSYKENCEKAAERSACVDLLKEMLQLDPTNRITPIQILAHPFITRSYSSNGNETAAVQPNMDQEIGNTKTDAKSKDDNRCSVKSGPRVILVKSAEKTMRGEEVPKPRSDKRCSVNPGPRLIMVKPALTKNRSDTSRCDVNSGPRVIVVKSADKTMRGEEVTKQRVDTRHGCGDAVLEPLSDSDIEESGMVDIKGIVLHPQDTLHAEEEVDDERRKKKKKGIRKFFSTLKRKFLCCFCFQEDNYVYDFKPF